MVHVKYHGVWSVGEWVARILMELSWTQTAKKDKFCIEYNLIHSQQVRLLLQGVVIQAQIAVVR